MQMTVEQCGDDIIRISLDGRLDMQGTQEIDQRFAFATSTKAMRLVVDLSRVSFMASIGLRALVAAAKAQSARGGRMVLVRPAPVVGKVLEIAGIEQLIPSYENFESACSALGA
jgi:anti-anti-sigma factor